jgi:TonB family protein
MAHALIVYALIREPEDSLAGGGGQLVDAISVTIVSSNVLESRKSEDAHAAPVSTAPVEREDGTPVDAAASSSEKPEESKEERKDIQDKPPEEPIKKADAILEVPSAKADAQPPPATAAAGGVAARSDAAGDTSASAPAAASAGAMREYARYVAQALAKTRPRGIGGKGTVRVKFIIGVNGDIAEIGVVRSSGNDKLDALAVGAVQKTKLPPPPAGMTVTQLTYEVPYYFR